MRKLAGFAGLVVGVVAVAMSAYHVYARLTTYAPDQQALLFITLAFSLVLSFLLWPLRGKRRRPIACRGPTSPWRPCRSRAWATCSRTTTTW